jgi:hypothetical protein
MSGEFNRQSGASPEDANWEGWTPPWMSGEGQGPRGPFGFGRGFGGPRGGQGPRGPFGPRFWFGGPWQGWGHGPFGHGFGPGQHWGVPDELLALRSEAAEVARLFAIASRGAVENKERMSQLRALLDRSRKELSDMIYGSAQGQATGDGGSASSSTDFGQA